MPTPDRIQQSVLLDSPVARVWRALTDFREFGSWFKVALEGPFLPGQVARGPITHPGMEQLTWEATVETLEPMTRFAFRWHPGGIDPDVDYASEPTTLVAFTLQASSDGTLLEIEETGFEAIPEARRARAYDLNKGGWAWQAGSIARYLRDARE